MEHSEQLKTADDLNNQGIIFGQQGRLPEAAQCFQNALALNPRHATAHNNLGIAIAHYGDIPSARQCFANTLAIDPDNARALTNDALLLLLQGHFEEGWHKYEHRIRMETREPLKNRWNGADIAEQTLAVMYEQGAGDTIQFIRYLPILRERCGNLIFLCRPEMKSLLTGFPGIDLLTDTPEDVSYHAIIELLSVPGLLKTDLNTIPNTVPYLFASPEKSAYWKKRMNPDKLNAGLCWAGNPSNGVDWKRSIHLADFAPLVSIEGVVFHSLQVAHRSEEADSPPQGMCLENPAKEIRDFTDTAAILDNLDLIITVDTSVAHLAGAMGKPVWILLPLMPDWRWMLNREDSPWYPTARLFRQSQADQWQEVIQRVGNELKILVSKRISKQAYAKGVEYQARKESEKAIENFRKVLAVTPDHAKAHNNIGLLLMQRGDYSPAETHFAQALATDPEYESALFNQSLLLLLHGHFREGWKKYEYRPSLYKDIPVRKWDGSPMPDQTLLVVCEQGIGDNIQFIRYLPVVRQLCGKLIFLSLPELKPLITFPGIEVLTNEEERHIPCHALIRLMSIPGVLNTEMETIPANIPYITASSERAAFWKKTMVPEKLNIGLCWAGNPNHQTDEKRSLHLADFAPLSQISGVAFHSLQVAHRAEEADLPPDGMRLENHVKEIHDFTDTAAIIDNLDIVITVDTSIAHLAGAMGKPVWILLPFSPDWRWMLNREDSPWYPTARLFRQIQPDRWAEVISRVAGELQKSVRNRAAELRTQARAYMKENRMNEALSAAEHLISLAPEYADAHFIRGYALQSLGNMTLSEESFRQVISMKPGLAEAHFGLGVSLQNQRKYKEAIECYRQAVALNPKHINAYNNLGNLSAHYGQLAKARECFVRIREIDPNNTMSLACESLLLLLEGNFSQGWKKYEYRPGRHKTRIPKWDGSVISEQTLMVHHEQGLGDTIQFIRYLPIVRSYCKKTVFVCQPQLMPLLKDFPGIDMLTDISETAEAQSHAAIELLSIPGVLNTTSETIPNKIPYLFASAEKAAIWKNIMAKDKLNVGIVWAGNSKNSGDWERSLHLADFAPFTHPGIVFHSLQVGDRTEEADHPPEGMCLENPAEDIHDFSDTAAIIENLDLVISVDTAVVHLAGAMGKPIWILLPFIPDWRWMLHREDSPWYPTARLFRQPQPDHWQEVILQVKQELEQLVRKKADSHFRQGYQLYSQSKMAEAERYFRQGISLLPDYFEAVLGLGVVLEKQNRFEESLEAYRKARDINPEHTEAYVGLGNVFKELRQHEESALNYQKAVLLNPDHVEAWKGVAGVMRDQGRMEEALLCSRKAVSLAPNDIETILSLGNLQKAMGNVGDAIAAYRNAVSLDPNHARSRMFLALALLLAGEFEEGWREYECRRNAESGVENHSYPAPRWKGEPLLGQRILIHCEQGFGDTFQFIRYLPLLKQMGAEVILECQPETERLLSQYSDLARIVPRAQKLPDYDYHCMLMSLPYLFKTDMSNLPCDIPYLTAEPAALPNNSPGIFKVGIVWAGNPSHKHDKKRSIPLSCLTRILEVPNVRFYSLQVGGRASDIQESCAFAHITDLSKDLKDFSDTASVIAALDLVISVDTAVVHLAGAMGKPVWVMLPFGPDFRWMRDREDNPWYPTLRLFRQPAPEQWRTVIDRIAEELTFAAKGDKSHLTPDHYRKPKSLPTLPHKEETMQESIMQKQDKMTALKLCRHGTMLYLKKDIYIGRSFDLYSEFSEGEIEVFAQLIRPGDIVVEAGANIGAHTIFFAKAVGANGKVFAYEPQRFIHQILCANIAFNELTNVYTRQAALGESAGYTAIPPLDYSSQKNFGGLSMGMGTESVSVETIDSLNLDRLRFIKADVEGMETEVIRGAIQTIQRLRPILYVENDRFEKSAALIALIRSLNYRLWKHDVPLFNPTNFAGVSENIFGNIVSMNLLCFPKEFSININGMEEV